MRKQVKSRMLPFEEALLVVRAEVIKCGISNQKKWFQYCHDGLKPDNIPHNPSRIYRNNGWVSYGHWLGNGHIQGCPRKHRVNESFFKTWSHDMAYILGFWFADGNIARSKNTGYHFNITQHKDDAYILSDILNRMDAEDYPLRPKDNCLNIIMNSKEIYYDIIALGGKERKSKDVKFPTIPEEYLPDFVRGYFDGDGCISRFGVSCISFFTCGSLDFISSLYDCLQKRFPNFKGAIRKIEAKWQTIHGKQSFFGENYKLLLTPNDTRKLRDWMYNKQDNELRLVRKYKKFLAMGDARCDYKLKESVKYGLERI